MFTNGKVDFVGMVSDTGVLWEAGFEDFADKARAHAGRRLYGLRHRPQGERRHAGTVRGRGHGMGEDSITLLCGASGVFQCFLYCSYCSALGTTPAGLGCAVIGGLIVTAGCASVINQLCQHDRVPPRYRFPGAMNAGKIGDRHPAMSHHDSGRWSIARMGGGGLHLPGLRRSTAGRVALETQSQ